jgi:hypothetical protein
MSASQAVIVVGVSLVILIVMITVMVRVNRISRQRIERRREAWKAEGNEGPYPGDDPGGSLYRINPDFPLGPY